MIELRWLLKNPGVRVLQYRERSWGPATIHDPAGYEIQVVEVYGKRPATQWGEWMDVPNAHTEEDSPK